MLKNGFSRPNKSFVAGEKFGVGVELNGAERFVLGELVTGHHFDGARVILITGVLYEFVDAIHMSRKLAISVHPNRKLH